MCIFQTWEGWIGLGRRQKKIKKLQREAHVAGRQEKSKMVMITARGWGLPFWSCQQNSGSRQAGGFSHKRYVCSAHREAWKQSLKILVFLALFPHRESGGELFFWDGHNLVSSLPSTNSLKRTIRSVSQPLTSWDVTPRRQVTFLLSLHSPHSGCCSVDHLVSCFETRL